MMDLLRDNKLINIIVAGLFFFAWIHICTSGLEELNLKISLTSPTVKAFFEHSNTCNHDHEDESTHQHGCSCIHHISVHFDEVTVSSIAPLVLDVF